MNYRLAYAIGFHPWEDLIEHPPFADRLLGLIAREERGAPPYGPALDIGTGSGLWAIELARRGWRVTGIDHVPKALRRARDRAGDAGVEVTFLAADVTDLRPPEVGTDYRLLLDTGTFHGLGADERASMAAGVTAVAAPGATLILDCFTPRRRGPLPRGADRSEVERAFPEWRIVDEVDADTDPDPISRLFRFDERFYTLARDANGPTPRR